ncbi:MAG TPA: ABATE domain-containing protein [Terriglobales bacterium]|nr:ABATE domain-containing protein [Terriglobales bacterium]
MTETEKQNNETTSRRRAPRFDLMGGPVCLDFINTLDDRFKSEPKELLASYVDLVRFAEDTGILGSPQVDRLFALSQGSPEAAGRALRAGIQLREAMYAVIWAVMTNKPVPQGALITLNQYVQAAAQHSFLVQSGLVQAKGRFEWRFEDAAGNFDAPLWPIARSAAELLASEELEFVRACASETCQWLFLDVSKNHRRRWCDMTRCGNRAKVRRFYRRKKKGAS